MSEEKKEAIKEKLRNPYNKLSQQKKTRLNSTKKNYKELVQYKK